MNKKGFSALSVLISIIIFGILAVSISNFDSYISLHKLKVSNQETFNSVVDSEVASIYSGTWRFSDKVIKTSKGNVNVKKKDLGITEYGTRKMKVDFSFKELNKTIEIERSQYYE